MLLRLLLILSENMSRKQRNNWISRRGLIDWPPKSLDLTPLDFFPKGYLKDQVYYERIESFDLLKARVRQAIRSIGTASLSNVEKTSILKLIG